MISRAKAAQADLDRLFTIDADISAARSAARGLEAALAAASAELDRIGRLPPLSRVPVLEIRRDEVAADLAEQLRLADVHRDAIQRNLNMQEELAAAGDLDTAILQAGRGLELDQWLAGNLAAVDALTAEMESIEDAIAAAQRSDEEAAAVRAAKDEEIDLIRRDLEDAQRLLEALESDKADIIERLDAEEGFRGGEIPSVFRAA